MSLYDVQHDDRRDAAPRRPERELLREGAARGRRCCPARTGQRRQAALKICEEIDELESDADRVMRSAISQLFREETDVRELIKLKAVYELLESTTDQCEDVANVIEGVVLENA